MVGRYDAPSIGAGFSPSNLGPTSRIGWTARFVSVSTETEAPSRVLPSPLHRGQKGSRFARMFRVLCLVPRFRSGAGVFQ